ncbi:hypothetical protein [Candidatus Tisiphia endosymbiont of Oplodontha viridula]|uniref:hypothetical protein n=1 Tax=Candidatus Tisiphia endosymbiont of Oplodontha viridula TaxID=3077925 RepID=UPI0035C8F29E
MFLSQIEVKDSLVQKQIINIGYTIKRSRRNNIKRDLILNIIPDTYFRRGDIKTVDTLIIAVNILGSYS